MVWPLIIGAALLASGTLAQMNGAKQAEKAVRSKNLAELERQRNYDMRRQKANEQSLKNFEHVTKKEGDAPGESQLEKKQSALNAVYQDAIKSQVDSYLPGANSSSAPNVVNNAFKKRTQESEDRVRGQAEAFSRLNGLGSLLKDKNVDLNKSAQEISMVGNLARASEAVLPLELHAAQKRGAKMRMLGDHLAMAGSTMMSYGMAGGGGAGAGSAGSGAASGPPVQLYNPSNFR